MKILSVEFIRSCYDSEQFPRDRLPEVAFVGRSNVGKSSLINSFLHRKQVAKVSRTPGKTQAINFFRVKTTGPFPGGFYVVDLPGYGYAKVPKSVRAQWEPLIESYLTKRSELRGVLWLLDARGVMGNDLHTFEWLNSTGRRIVVVATKVDKLSRGEWNRSLRTVRESLGLPQAQGVIPYSSVTHEGREALWRAIREMERGHR